MRNPSHAKACWDLKVKGAVPSTANAVMLARERTKIGVMVARREKIRPEPLMTFSVSKLAYSFRMTMGGKSETNLPLIFRIHEPNRRQSQ
jgi:hypothetical protein